MIIAEMLMGLNAQHADKQLATLIANVWCRKTSTQIGPDPLVSCVLRVMYQCCAPGWQR